MDKADAISEVKQKLADFLKLSSRRNTPERNQLLEVIYSSEEPVSAEELSQKMADDNRFRISRATVYNNMLLFESAGLVRKVFIDGKVLFERTDRNRGVIRLICGVCGKDVEMNNDKMRRLISEMRTRRFTVMGWVLTLNGLCAKCSADLKRKQKRLNKTDNRK